MTTAQHPTRPDYIDAENAALDMRMHSPFVEFDGINFWAAWVDRRIAERSSQGIKDKGLGSQTHA